MQGAEELVRAAEPAIERRAAPKAARSGRLFRRYAAVLMGLVAAALLLQGMVDLAFDYQEIRVDLDPAQREAMVARAKRTSVPQIFIDGEHIGGFDDLAALNRQGGLERFGSGA